MMMNIDDSASSRLIFKDMLYFVSGEINPKCENILKEGGAKKSKYLGGRVTHLIAGLNAKTIEIEEANELWEIPALNEDWVLLSYASNQKLPIRGFQVDSNQLFSGVVAKLEDFSFEDTNRLWAMIRWHGGNVVSNTSLATHCVSAKNPSANVVSQRSSAESTNFWIVSPNWILESLKQGKKLNESEYCLNYPTQQYNKSNIIGILRKQDIDADINATQIPPSVVKYNDICHIKETEATMEDFCADLDIEGDASNIEIRFTEKNCISPPSEYFNIASNELYTEKSTDIVDVGGKEDLVHKLLKLDLSTNDAEQSFKEDNSYLCTGYDSNPQNNKPSIHAFPIIQSVSERVKTSRRKSVNYGDVLKSSLIKKHPTETPKSKNSKRATTKISRSIDISENRQDRQHKTINRRASQRQSDPTDEICENLFGLSDQYVRLADEELVDECFHEDVSFKKSRKSKDKMKVDVMPRRRSIRLMEKASSLQVRKY